MASPLTIRHQLELVRAADSIERRADRRLRRVDTANVDAWWLANSPDLVRLVAQGFGLTSRLAARYVVEHGRENGVDVTPARQVRANTEQVEASLLATGPVAFKQHLVKSKSVEAAAAMMRKRSAAAIARQALAGARKMTMATIDGNRAVVGYRRIARPGACEFCQMLAGRGAVYKSQRSASGVVGRAGRARGDQRVGQSYHDNCRCVTEPIYRVE